MKACQHITTCAITRPCWASHQAISAVGLIAGGHVPMPGEVSIAHHGVLFLDAGPACRRHVVAIWRQPLRVLYAYNLAGIIDLHTFVELAIRVKAVREAGGAR